MENFQGDPIYETNGKIQVENSVNCHRPFCLNLNGFNSQNPPKPGENLA